MAPVVETGGSEEHGPFKGRTVGIHLTHEDPVYRDSRLTVVGIAGTEQAHLRSREADSCQGTGGLGFRKSPAAGPWISPVNPGAGVAHGRIRIFNACRSARETTSHVERIDDDVGAARGGATSNGDHYGVAAGCE